VFPAAPLQTVHAVLPHTAFPRIFTCPQRELPLSARYSLVRSTVAVVRSVSPEGTHQRRSLPRMMRLQAFPRLRFCCPKATIGTMPAPTPSRVAVFALPERVSPVPCTTLPAFRVLYAGGFLVGAFPRSSPLPWAFAFWDQARLPLALCIQRSITARQTSRYAADCRFAQPPSEAFVSGLCRRPAGRPRPEPGTSSPLSYSAAGAFPRPDSHR